MVFWPCSPPLLVGIHMLNPLYVIHTIMLMQFSACNVTSSNVFGT